ncbi:MAG: putative extracellular protein [Rhodobacteraceae bacterium HLUCCA08]|nr:MAG: putative extracellular protein [Rhodobacteraceae bacterium HLUCCA08]
MALLKKALAVGALLTLGATAQAATLNPTENAVILDYAPFNSVGSEDTIGFGNYALNYGTFIDMPYAIFDFGGLSSVSSAVLNLDFLGPYGGSGPTSITLYTGIDTDGVITTLDRFMGIALDSYVYGSAVSRMIDITAEVNASLTTGDDFAIRLEVDAAPGTFSGFAGGQFATPTITYETGVAAVPLPAGLPLLGGGLLVLFGWNRRKQRAA